MALAFNGPTAMNDAASRFPHIDPRDFSTFSPVNPEHVLDDWETYLWSASFISWVVAWVFVFYPVGQWVSECYRCCDCCAAERKRCECDCCPKRCCTPLTLNKEKPQADVIAPVAVFGFIGFALAVCTMVFQGMAQWSVDDTISIFRQLDTVHKQNLDMLQKAADQMGTNSDQLSALIIDSQAAGVPPIDVLLIEDALFRFTQPARDRLIDAYNAANVDLGISSVADNAHNAVVWVIVVGGIYFAFIVLAEFGSYMAAYFPRRPINPLTIAISSSYSACLLVLGSFLVVPALELLVVGGDLCQDPHGYILRRNNNTGNSDYVTFYVDCPAGQESPNLPDLIAAGNATEDAYSLVNEYGQYLIQNGSYDTSLYDQTLVIEAGLNRSIAQIDGLIVVSGCETYNSLLNHGLNDACGKAFSSNFLWILGLPLTLIFLLLKICFVPRAEDPGYSSVEDEEGGT